MSIYLKNLDWIKDVIIPFASVFLGACLAFYFERRSRNDEREERYRSHLRLLRNDIEKAKRFVAEFLGSLPNLERENESVPYYELPTSYFGAIDFVGLASYVSEDCVEHIRNITEYVFPRWNQNLKPILLSEEQPTNVRLESARNLARQTISACDVVIKSITEELKV